MSAELFLGGLASLILSAVIIVMLTGNKRGEYPEGSWQKDKTAEKSRRSTTNRRSNS